MCSCRFILLFMCLILPGHGEEALLKWDSPKIRELEREVEQLKASFDGPSTKSNFQERSKRLDELMRARLTEQQMSELSKTAPLQDEESVFPGFDGTLCKFMVGEFVRSGNREDLLVLLSHRYPRHYGLLKTESFMVSTMSKIEDPIPLLGEAYSKAKNPMNQQRIAGAFRDAFKGFGLRANTDAEFVALALEWHEANKGKLERNPLYDSNYGYSPIEAPLFKWKGVHEEPFLGEDRWEMLPAVQVAALRNAENSIGMKLALLPAGKFTMGSSKDEPGHDPNEYPPHPVRISKPFWMGAHEVTRGDYKAVMGQVPALDCCSGYDLEKDKGVDFEKLPVSLTWYEALEFCNELSKLEGLPPYYKFLKKPDPDTRLIDVEELGGNGYRLPTEAEWEYACRAGTNTPYAFGEKLTDKQANIGKEVGKNEEFSDRPVVVGSYPANAFGLHDMHGNMPEWCNDGYGHTYYHDSPIDDPTGITERRKIVVRGGTYANEASFARSAWRREIMPYVDGAGFRVARNVAPEKVEE